jgi:hypothetical protein
MGRYPDEMFVQVHCKFKINRFQVQGAGTLNRFGNSTASFLAIGNHPHVGAISPASGTPPHGALSVKSTDNC